MVDLEQVKSLPRPARVEPAGAGLQQQRNCGQLNISPRTAKQHLRAHCFCAPESGMAASG
jgi:hypothetical protein